MCLRPILPLRHFLAEAAVEQLPQVVAALGDCFPKRQLLSLKGAIMIMLIAKIKHKLIPSLPTLVYTGLLVYTMYWFVQYDAAALVANFVDKLLGWPLPSNQSFMGKLPATRGMWLIVG